jgi:hypothetical protein
MNSQLLNNVVFSLSLLLISTQGIAGHHPRINNPRDYVWHFPLHLNEGRKIVSDLDQQFGLDSTTSFRKETKATVPGPALAKVMKELEAGKPEKGVAPLAFRSREKVESELPHGNFTYYGRAAGFRNDGGRKTAIRMRVRMYVGFQGNFTQVTRSPEAANLAWLELKIKNPNDQEPDGVHKYRINLEDKDILKLFRANPADANFSAVIQELKANAIGLHMETNTEKKVNGIFNAIEALARKEPSFIQPLFVTAYARNSYSYTQTDYEISLPPVTKKKKFSNLWGHLGSQYKLQEKKKVKAEFQITIDNHVRGYKAQVFPEDTVLEIQRYFNPGFKGQVVNYPENAVVIELKEPGDVSQLRASQQSATHLWIKSKLIPFMTLEHLPNFLVNRGKAGHLTRLMRDELFSADPAFFYDDQDLRSDD